MMAIAVVPLIGINRRIIGGFLVGALGRAKKATR